MTLLTEASRFNTATQLNNWNTIAQNSMSQAKDSYTSIYTQRQAMVDNPEYTQADIDEVDKMLSNILLLAEQLINPTV